MKWKITVPHLSGGWQDHYNTSTSTDVVKVATHLSATYPTARVTISALARNRMVFMAGKVIDEVADINHFYTNIDTHTQLEWANIN